MTTYVMEISETVWYWLVTPTSRTEVVNDGHCFKINLLHVHQVVKEGGHLWMLDAEKAVLC